MVELSVAITLVVGLAFVAVLGVHAFRVWASSNASSIRLELTQQHEAQLQIMQERHKQLYKAVDNWSTRYRALKRQGLDLGPDDDEYLEEEIDPQDADKLSEFAKVLYPKLPPVLAKIIDNEQFQEAIVNTAQKNATGISAVLEKFLKPREQEPKAAPGSATNITQSNQLWR